MAWKSVENAPRPWVTAPTWKAGRDTWAQISLVPSVAAIWVRELMNGSCFCMFLPLAICLLNKNKSQKILLLDIAFLLNLHISSADLLKQNFLCEERYLL